MDVSSVQAVAQSASPQPRPDLRPTADAAALVRDPSPEVPLPPTLSQQGVVSAGMLRSTVAPQAIREVEPSTRTLKPYGITMLPSDEAREAAREAAKAEAEAAQADRDARRADDVAAEANRVAAEAASKPDPQAEEAEEAEAADDSATTAPSADETPPPVLEDEPASA